MLESWSGLKHTKPGCLWFNRGGMVSWALVGVGLSEKLDLAPDDEGNGRGKGKDMGGGIDPALGLLHRPSLDWCWNCCCCWLACCFCICCSWAIACWSCFVRKRSSVVMLSHYYFFPGLLPANEAGPQRGPQRGNWMVEAVEEAEVELAAEEYWLLPHYEVVGWVVLNDLYWWVQVVLVWANCWKNCFLLQMLRACLVTLAVPGDDNKEWVKKKLKSLLVWKHLVAHERRRYVIVSCPR